MLPPPPQLVSRLRPLVLEGGVDEADYDLLENRNLGNTVNQVRAHENMSDRRASYG